MQKINAYLYQDSLADFDFILFTDKQTGEIDTIIDNAIGDWVEGVNGSEFEVFQEYIVQCLTDKGIWAAVYEFSFCNEL